MRSIATTSLSTTSANGKLYWDVDGSGSKAQVEIATIKLEKNAGLITASDFYFV